MFKTFAITDVGRKRKVNQDYVYTSEKPVGPLDNLFIVADGMGGHKAGDFASKMTVETMVSEISASSGQDVERIFGGAIEKANQLVRRTAAMEADLEGMGTTVVAAACAGQSLRVVNVGDSRLYVVGREIRQITKDHSVVEEMVRRGIISRDEARIHPDKNKITKAVGASETVKPDYFSVELKPGELVLMCTDGLTNMLEDEEIRMIISGARDIVEMAQKLVDAANENGGKDNISVVLIEQAQD